MTNEIFEKNITDYLKIHNIPKQNFCDFLELSRSSFVNWNKQKSIPNAETVIKIANFLKVSAEDLLYKSNLFIEKNKFTPDFNGFIKRLDILLKLNNLKLEYLCEQINISQSAISNLRKCDGIPTADTTWKIANYFHISLDWLISGKINYEIKEEVKTIKNIKKSLLRDLNDIEEKIKSLL